MLLLDPDAAARCDAQVRLRECGYFVQPCASEHEAGELLTAAGAPPPGAPRAPGGYDVLLVDVSCAQPKSGVGAKDSWVARAQLPVVLMSSRRAEPEEVGQLAIKPSSDRAINPATSLTRVEHAPQLLQLYCSA